MKISVMCKLLHGKINVEYLLYYCNHKSCHCTYNPPLCLLVQLCMYMVTLVSQNAYIGLLLLFKLLSFYIYVDFYHLKCTYGWFVITSHLILKFLSDDVITIELTCGGFIFTADFFEFMSKFVIIPHAIILWMLGHPRGYENVNM